MIEKWSNITGNKELILINPTADVKSNQVDNRCIVWENCKLSEKTSFKNSILGSNTEVQSFSRVFNCVVMNNVVIKERYDFLLLFYVEDMNDSFSGWL